MDALQAFEKAAKAAKSSAELGAKAGRAYVCAIRQAYRDVIHADDLLAAGYENLAADPEWQAMDAARRARRDRERLVEWEAEREVSEPRMECDGPDAAEPLDMHPDAVYGREYVAQSKRLDAARAVQKGVGFDALAEALLATPQVPSSSAGRGVGSPGVSAGAEEPAPPGWRHAVGAIVAEVLAEHQAWLRTTDDGYNGRVYCYGACFGDDCAPHAMYDDQRAWREHVAPLIAAAVGVGATPTPKPAEAEAASTFEQHRKTK